MSKWTTVRERKPDCTLSEQSPLPRRPAVTVPTVVAPINSAAPWAFPIEWFDKRVNWVDSGEVPRQSNSEFLS
jgi:hypothetical protein